MYFFCPKKTFCDRAPRILVQTSVLKFFSNVTEILRQSECDAETVLIIPIMGSDTILKWFTVYFIVKNQTLWPPKYRFANYIF